MASHIPLVEDGRVIGIDGKPLAPLPINAWAGLPFEVHPHMRKGEVEKRHNPHPLLLVHLGAHGRSRIRSGRQVFDLALSPGLVDVFSTGFHMDYGWWDCTPGEVIAIELAPEQTRGFGSDDSGAFEPETRLAVRDVVLERLAACMRAEVEAGCPSGKLFAEALSIALVERLRSRGVGGTPSSARYRKLSERQLREIVDFVDANIGRDLSVACLAGQIAMSAYTFSRRFKTTFDTTPHRYVMRHRIRRAESMLASDASLSEISLALGFASQSHFTEAFRRQTGRTPAAARRGAG